MTDENTQDENVIVHTSKKTYEDGSTKTVKHRIELPQNLVHIVFDISLAVFVICYGLHVLFS